jgi:hypothetical protein
MLSSAFRITKGAQKIRTVKDWETHAPPKGGSKQWKADFSAMALAEAWCGTGTIAAPIEIVNLLSSEPIFQSAVLDEATPEHRLPFDAWGEPRNSDMVIRATINGCPLAITVEGKANEPFDRTVAKVLQDGDKRILRGENTNIHARVQGLVKAILPPLISSDQTPQSSQPGIGELRYQLLTATAGTLAYAHQLDAKIALLIVHEFIKDPNSEAAGRNAGALDDFVMRLSLGQITGVSPQKIVGPFHLPGGGLMARNVSFYIGKARR